MNEESNQNLLADMDFEAKHNLLGFFELLLKIDMRNNPQIYKRENYEDNGSANNTNKSQ